MYDLIVIGAGPGGYESAAHAARMGKKVALVEKEFMAAAGMVETEMCFSGASQIGFPHPTVSDALREAILGIH